MLNAAFRSSCLIGVWVAAVTIIVAGSRAMGANLSTTAVLLALGLAPAIIVALTAHAEPLPSVAQILHTVETKDGERAMKAKTRLVNTARSDPDGLRG